MSMNPFRDKLLQPERRSFFNRNSHPHDGAAASPSFEFRQFSLQPIVGPNKQGFGSEARFCSGSEDFFTAEPNSASRIMLDNWFLYGFEELIGGRAVFLDCTRETLLSGILSLLPHTAVFEIPESVKADDEVLSVCRSLKAAGYRLALDHFESPKNMEEFLDLADFIKVDFKNSRPRKRACMLRDLKLTGATLIADKIESEGDFHQAAELGFGLFQGIWIGELVTYAKKAEPLHPMICTCILGAIEEPHFVMDELAELVNLESGIERRLLRRANWACPQSVAINTTRDAFEVVGKADLQKIVTLMMTAVSEESMAFQSAPRQRPATKYFGADALVHWMEMGEQTPWWYGAGEAAI
jgi:EAL and modified HD-GYP domain-containing signal transduction protein